MKSFLLIIHWERPKPHPDKPNSGQSTHFVRAKSLRAAKRKARTKFKRQHGSNLTVTSITERQDPAGIFTIS